MSIRRWGAWREGLVLLTVLLTLGVSLCLFDQDGDLHDGMALDFCLLMVLAPAITHVLLERPLLSGRADADLPVMVTTASGRTLDPPPKRARQLQSD
jgi:hypothetical protein